MYFVVNLINKRRCGLANQNQPNFTYLSMRFLIFLSFGLFSITNGYNFLVYCPLFGHSHSKFFGTIADALTDAGHNVVSGLKRAFFCSGQFFDSC